VKEKEVKKKDSTSCPASGNKKKWQTITWGVRKKAVSAKIGEREIILPHNAGNGDLTGR